jgi:hypothetical protein
LTQPRLTEADSRPIPYARAEFDWAHERPAPHRVRTPTAGDTILYRHDAWGPPTDAAVDWVQPADDIDDPHLWTPMVDEHDRPIMFQGQPVMRQKIDPWPQLRLRTRWGTVITREARLRGSPGWLPLDWQARYRPIPEMSTAAPPMAPLQPAPAPGPTGGGG